MKRTIISLTKSRTLFYYAAFFLSFQMLSAQEFCIETGADQKAGTQDGFRYELWNENSQGTACMTLGNGALFSGNWSGIQNYLSRRGLGYDQTKEHQEYGKFSSTYNCNYHPSSSSGNSYLSVYGWTVEPLVEYYIIEDWRNWIPSMAAGASLIDTFTVDGSTYEIYENTRVNKPSIVGNRTFQQYFSIRQDERSSGSIDISAHFDKWESLGMDLGKLHEVSIVVEGYQSSGNFEFTELDVIVDNTTLSIDELDTQDYFTVYPNPSNTDNAIIQLKKSGLNSEIQVYDSFGKMVYQQKNAHNESIHISNLKSGIYFINVRVDSKSFTSKLIAY
ncbi:glycoside hydrolase family 11 protein [uncultured Aquimarina sp.]|uniref:glycoside hydrolase family 11 protein n=1 Tax=uncultured Aquimarina sp. TaxID=575652 RepID=UPI002624E20E|nr:glycoside hydrolase family 11 protein [uncultured Aquimarina sp.]